MISIKKEYITTWRNKWITSGAESIDDFIRIFESLAKKFKEWKELGIRLVNNESIADDYATFITDEIDVALKANFVFTMGVGDDETQYLETSTHKKVKVPKEKLDKIKK